MIGVATVAGPNLRMVFECEQPVDGQPVFTVQSVTSADDGVTWSGDRQLVYAAVGALNNAGSPQIAAVPAPGGGTTLAVVFMTDEDTGGRQWVSGSDVKMVVSADGGSTWGGKVTVGGVQSNWPGIVAVGEGEALVLYESGGSKVRRVTIG